jgi:hypothetical protein
MGLLFQIIQLFFFVVLVSISYGFQFRNINGRIYTALKVNPDSSPSDSEILALKHIILDEVGGTQNGVSATENKRYRIESAASSLAKHNKVSLQESNLPMKGIWKLVYTTNKEFSSGKVGPFIGQVIQLIDLEKEIYKNYLDLFRGMFEAKLEGQFQNLDENKWKVIFKSVELKIFGLSVFTTSLNGLGIWDLKYLDEDLRIFVAFNANNPDIQNLYILQKLSSSI